MKKVLPLLLLLTSCGWSQSGSGGGSVANGATFISPAALVILTSALQNCAVNQAFNQTLAGTGGLGSYTWSITAGSLPAGLTLNGSTGVISGTCTQAGVSTLTIQLADSFGDPSASSAFTLTVNTTGGAPTTYSALTVPHVTTRWCTDNTCATLCTKGNDCTPVIQPENPLPAMGTSGGTCYTLKGVGYSCQNGINAKWIDQSFPPGFRHQYVRVTDSTCVSTTSLGTDGSGNNHIVNKDDSLWLFTAASGAIYLVQFDKVNMQANSCTHLTIGSDYAFDPIDRHILWIWNASTGSFIKDVISTDASDGQLYHGNLTHTQTTISSLIGVPGNCVSDNPGNWNSIFTLPADGSAITLAISAGSQQQEHGHCIIHYKFDTVNFQQACTHPGQCGWRFYDTSPGSTPLSGNNNTASTGPGQITGQYGPTGTALAAETGATLGQTYTLHSGEMTPNPANNRLETNSCTSASATWPGAAACNGPWEWFVDTLYVASCKLNTTAGNCTAEGHGKDGYFGRWGGHYAIYETYGSPPPPGPYYQDNNPRIAYIGPDGHYAGGNNDDNLDDKPWFFSSFCSDDVVNQGSNCKEEYPTYSQGLEQEIVAFQPKSDASGTFYRFGPNYGDGNNFRFLAENGVAVVSHDGCYVAISSDGKGQFGPEGGTDTLCNIYSLTKPIGTTANAANACRGDVIIMDACHTY